MRPHSRMCRVVRITDTMTEGDHPQALKEACTHEGTKFKEHEGGNDARSLQLSCAKSEQRASGISAINNPVLCCE